MLRSVLLGVHITAGVCGLVLGPAAILAAVRGGRATTGAAAYQVAVAVVTTTAVGFAVLDWRRWWPFLILAVGTEWAVAAGWRVRRRPRPGWLGRHICLICGSYVSLVTALMVVSWGTLLAWVLPAVVGTMLIEVVAHRAAVPGALPSAAGAAVSGTVQPPEHGQEGADTTVS